ncbi:DNA-directed RNA polymerase subunit beta [Salisediminibacterium selenitireducens]|uniref:DNA-directed RNA polymerase subunit beta n=1 Tax=Bacillus selenitireducens (strain ATCC 700615 / DSM 15326 / MLS10) TaxID=439292 RepID=D6Y0P8_BACIE|nr:DNA-directed RNA polymerase subunit beta [Salisediminibacterium selenitireducens]ADI00616.1 hypothetical protein Bsel_3134 [[Bacillus] selenitireducens MLS10]
MSPKEQNNDNGVRKSNGSTKPMERVARDHTGIKQFRPDPLNAPDQKETEEETRLRSKDHEEQSRDEDGEDGKKKRKRKKKYRMRRFPIILRVLIILALTAGAVLLGAMVGYGIVGDGGDYMDVLDPETWWYIHDIIFQDTEFERER